MKPTPSTERTRAWGITVQCDGVSVYSDPLSHSLFGSTLPDLPAQTRGTLVTGEHPYLAFRRTFSLAGIDHTLYAAFPVSAAEAADPAKLATLAAREMDALADRFSLVLRETEGERAPLSSVPILYYFRHLSEQICRTLYAPLQVEVAGCPEAGTVGVHRTALSQAIGLALASLLRVGQSRLTMRLAAADGGYLLSLVGDQCFDSPFLYRLLDALAARGGFTVRRDACGLSFLLTATRTPAVTLREQGINDDVHLHEGFFLL